MTFVEHHRETAQPLANEWEVHSALEASPEELRDELTAQHVGEVVVRAYEELRDDLLPVPVYVRPTDRLEARQAYERVIVLPGLVHAVNGTKMAVLERDGVRYWSFHTDGSRSYRPQRDEHIEPRLAAWEQVLPTTPILEVIKSEYDFRKWAHEQHPEASSVAKVAQHILMQSATRSQLFGGARGVNLVEKDMQLLGYETTEIQQALQELQSYHAKPLDEVESEYYVSAMYKYHQRKHDSVEQPRRVPGVRSVR